MNPVIPWHRARRTTCTCSTQPDWYRFTAISRCSPTAADVDVHVEAGCHNRNARLHEIPCEQWAGGVGRIFNTEPAQALGGVWKNQASDVDDCQTTSLIEHFPAGECTGSAGS